MIKILNKQLMETLTATAEAIPRQRINYNLHNSYDDPVQRLCNAIQPGTYVHPHKHIQAGQWENFIILTGEAAILTFNDKGCVLQRVELSENGPNYGIEIAENVCHTLVALKPGTVLFEIKPGPYREKTDKDFVTWAPPEKHPLSKDFEAWFRVAQIGEACPLKFEDQGITTKDRA